MYIKSMHIVIYGEDQDTRPLEPHEPLDYGFYVGQIIEEDGKPRKIWMFVGNKLRGAGKY